MHSVHLPAQYKGIKRKYEPYLLRKLLIILSMFKKVQEPLIYTLLMTTRLLIFHMVSDSLKINGRRLKVARSSVVQD